MARKVTNFEVAVADLSSWATLVRVTVNFNWNSASSPNLLRRSLFIFDLFGSDAPKRNIRSRFPR